LISTNSGQYYILVGPRGSGKSSAIEKACQGKEGVARIRVDKSNVNVFELVADAFGINSSYYSFKKQDDLVKLFRQASAKKGGSWVPTIIAEIDRGAELGTVETVSKALKVCYFLNK
jgi:thymidine kinase